MFRSTIPTKKILVLGLDYDDCLIRKDTDSLDLITPVQQDAILNQNEHPHGDAWKQQLIKGNESLFQFIHDKVENGSYAKVIIVNTSNRQDFETDLQNSTRNNVHSGSCFLGLTLIENQLRQNFKEKGFDITLELDRTLMADYLFNNQKPGDEFNQSLRWINNQGEKPQHVMPPNDRNKIALYYMHMQRLTMLNPNHFIQFYGFDDQFQSDGSTPILHPENPSILNALGDAFGRHTDLIPTHTTLQLYCYTGTQPVQVSCIPGTGKLDRQFSKTMLDMMVWTVFGNTLEEKEKNLWDDGSCQVWDLLKEDGVWSEFFAQRDTRIVQTVPATTHQQPQHQEQNCVMI